MAAEQCLVVVGAQGWEGTWSPDHSLVIDADADALAAIAASGVAVRQAVLGRSDGETLDWHHFNDRRCDGPLGLEPYSQLFRNLALQHVEPRQSCTLARVLDELGGAWKGGVPLVLRLEQGDGLATLIGAEPVLGRVETITLGPVFAVVPGGADLVDGWLGSQGFRRVEEGALSWQRDAQWHCLLQECQALRARVAELETAMRGITTDVDELLQLLESS